ncbi:MAG: DNA polymerase III subunit delta [Bacteroidales bacterium]|jgi:DNA polymerase-3 subunit delta|nr:DNA polymerase III subunit delta [Bacteroidales bacterium]
MNQKYEEIIKDLKQKKFKPVYLLMGDEPFFIDRISEYFEEKLIDEPDRDFNQMIFYGNDKETDASIIVAAAREYPFGVPHKLVMVKEAKDLKNFAVIKEYAQNPSPSSILVICYKYGKLKADQYKPFDKNGVLFLSEAIKDNKIPTWISEQCKEHGFSIEATAASMLAEHIGNDLNRIYNEFVKLKIFLPENTKITTDLIEKHVGISKEFNNFELKNALGERDTKQAAKIVLNFCHNINEHPLPAIIGLLYPFFFNMLAYYLKPDNSPETLTRIYGNVHPYVLKLNEGYARRYSMPEVQRAIAILREFDMKSKGVDSIAPHEDLLKEMIFKIMMR